MMSLYLSNKVRHYDKVLHLYHEMIHLQIPLNEVIFLNSLKACSRLQLHEEGTRIHDSVIQHGYDQHIQIQIALIHFYSKLSLPEKAENIWNFVSEKDKTLRAYGAISDAFTSDPTNIHYNQRALAIFHDLKHRDDIQLDDGVYINALRALSNLHPLQPTESLNETLEIHRDIQSQRGYHCHKLWNTLISTFSKCGDFQSAWTVYRNMTKSGKFRRVNKITYITTLISCANATALDEGRQVHDDMLRDEVNQNVLSDVKIQSALINLYGKCGDIESAQNIWNQIPHSLRTIPTYGAMMAAYTKDTGKDSTNQMFIDYNIAALRLFDEIESTPTLQMDDAIYLVAIAAAGNARDFQKGLELHQRIESHYKLMGKTLDNIKLQSALILMYGRCGDMEKAQEVWNGIKYENHSERTYGTLMDAFAHCGRYHKVIEMYHSMKGHPDRRRCRCNEVTYLIVIKCIGNLEVDLYDEKVDAVKSLHRDIGNDVEFCENVTIKNALIHLYGKLKLLEDAEMVWTTIWKDNRTEAPYGAMMDIYGEIGHHDRVLELLEEIECSALMMNGIICLYALGACAELKLLDKVQEIHDFIQKRGELRSDVKVCNALINAYGKCGDVESAELVFNGMDIEKRTEVTYAAMMKSYELKGSYHAVMRVFEEMKKRTDTKMDEVCYLVVLSACAKDTELYDYGINIEEELRMNRKDIWSSWQIQTQCLINHGNIGDVETAEMIFRERISGNVKGREVSVWNAMIQIYGRNGMATEALELRLGMKRYGIKGDDITTIVLLNACSHNGLVGEANEIFNDYVGEGANVKEVYSAMTDCLARGGCLQDAREIVMKYEQCGYKPDHVMWIALLNGCRIHNDQEMLQIIGDAFLERFKDSNEVNIDNALKSASLLTDSISSILPNHSKGTNIRTQTF